MSTAAIMMVKDEADVLPAVLDHLAYHVDEIIVADNGSTDGTREILEAADLGVPLTAADDDEVGYYQSRKMTALAGEARARGHAWAVPVDADEAWYVAADPERRIADFLAGNGQDVMLVKAPLYDHLPTSRDPLPSKVPSPLRRIGWRKREHAPLPKVAVRLRPDLVIEPGNHGARTSGTALAGAGLVVRHFSWRSAEQYVRKIRNGERAYAETDLPESTGLHWRMWEGLPDEAIADQFRAWFWSAAPELDDSLIYDPAPVKP